MAIVKDYDESIIYAAIIEDVSAPTDPLIEVQPAIFRLLFGVYEVIDGTQTLVRRGEATALFCATPDSQFLRLLEVGCGSAGSALKGRWLRIQFTGRLRSRRQGLRPVAVFCPEKYAVRHGHETLQLVKVGWVAGKLERSEQTVRRLVKSLAATHKDLVQRRSARRDRIINVKSLYHALEQAGKKSYAEKLRRHLK